MRFGLKAAEPRLSCPSTPTGRDAHDPPGDDRVTAMVRGTAARMDQYGVLYPIEHVAEVMQSADVMLQQIICR